MVLLIDNFDSFTYNLVDYFGQLNMACDVRRNNIPIKKFIHNEYDGVVLSPGPETPYRAGNLMKVIDHYINTHPVLGICLGHQAIGQHFGAGLVKARIPMHGKVIEIYCKNHKMYNNISKKHKVARYNSLIIDKVPSQVSITAQTATSEIMAIAHKSMPIWGVQYHPEAVLSEYGLQTIHNWIKLCK